MWVKASVPVLLETYLILYIYSKKIHTPGFIFCFKPDLDLDLIEFFELVSKPFAQIWTLS